MSKWFMVSMAAFVALAVVAFYAGIATPKYDGSLKEHLRPAVLAAMGILGIMVLAMIPICIRLFQNPEASFAYKIYVICGIGLVIALLAIFIRVAWISWEHGRDLSQSWIR
jgi:hypothetical protein